MMDVLWHESNDVWLLLRSAFRVHGFFICRLSECDSDFEIVHKLLRFGHRAALLTPTFTLAAIFAITQTPIPVQQDLKVRDLSVCR